MTDYVTCPECGTQTEAEKLFCPACGEILVVDDCDACKIDFKEEKL